MCKCIFGYTHGNNIHHNTLPVKPRESLQPDPNRAVEKWWEFWPPECHRPGPVVAPSSKQVGGPVLGQPPPTVLIARQP